MEANTTGLISQSSAPTEPTKVWTYTTETRQISDSATLGPKPITVEGESVRISPKLMRMGEPYAFWFAGAYLIAVKRGEEHVDVYTVPPL